MKYQPAKNLASLCPIDIGVESRLPSGHLCPTLARHQAAKQPDGFFFFAASPHYSEPCLQFPVCQSSTQSLSESVAGDASAQSGEIAGLSDLASQVGHTCFYFPTGRFQASLVAMRAAISAEKNVTAAQQVVLVESEQVCKLSESQAASAIQSNVGPASAQMCLSVVLAATVAAESATKEAPPLIT